MKYICSICGYVYDEEAEGVPFASLPDGWVCPMCGAVKDAFEPEEVPAAAPAAAAAPAKIVDEDMQELSTAQLSALFSNLARGCEKQYMPKESELFRELADYFGALSPVADAADLSALADTVLANLQNEYPAVEAQARENADRGALRAWTWGNKVTKIQQTLLKRYQQKGEAFLEHTDVWVCTVCGFIYVGGNPPELCPVC